MAEELPTVMAIESHSHASSTKKRPSKNDKLCLEDYLHLLHSRQTLHLTVVRIHGFKKIHHAPKDIFCYFHGANLREEREIVLEISKSASGFRSQKLLVDAVESLDLVDLARSTLSESVSAFDAVTLEDLVADLGDLKWQECCVTSVKKFSFCDGESMFPASSDQSLRVMTQNHSQSMTQKSKRIDETGNHIPEASRKSLKTSKMMPKRIRSSARALDSVASTVDSASLASC
ncbi:uncharacterized protein LOC113859662 [Abrus precatorius]|uniref:Uncharacterized protein LOC113859662 n=1 Tax=Abrus precatorius TaxID=3816 RepID=A0A8B8KW51_ABRPR|nr:uncharacterized protein LOC113859662 [Abrus precatorius]